jgi:hypothetical protein
MSNPGNLLIGYYFAFLLFALGVLTFGYLKKMSQLHVRNAPLPLGILLTGAGAILVLSWWYGIFIMVAGSVLVVGDIGLRIRYIWRIYSHD